MKASCGTLSPAYRLRRAEPAILFSIAGQAFAISAEAIHEIRSTDSLSSAASEIAGGGIAKVRHRLRRGRKFYYVVNGCEHFGLPTSRPTLVLILRGTRVALLVDSVDRMATISLLMPLPPSFSGPERAWYRGLTLIEESVVPVTAPSGFLSSEEISRLDAFAESEASSEEFPAIPQGNESRGAAVP